MSPLSSTIPVSSQLVSSAFPVRYLFFQVLLFFLPDIFPLLSIASPVQGIASPVQGIATPVQGIASSVQGSAACICWSGTPAPHSPQGCVSYTPDTVTCHSRPSDGRGRRSRECGCRAGGRVSSLPPPRNVPCKHCTIDLRLSCRKKPLKSSNTGQCVLSFLSFSSANRCTQDIPTV